MTRSPAER